MIHDAITLILQSTVLLVSYLIITVHRNIRNGSLSRILLLEQNRISSSIIYLSKKLYYCWCKTKYYSHTTKTKPGGCAPESNT
mmetsp:Transcript_86989/g.177185  ORF Transcript_86989/g.177185 Transcript_86989/m.177185 type:complete len:83 (+) Transcript_86989:1310-1558(+)